MAEDQGKQRGEDDGKENVADKMLGNPQILTTLPSTTPSSSSTRDRTKTASAPSAAGKKPSYYSKDLEKLPQHDRRRIEREIRKRRKPGECRSFHALSFTYHHPPSQIRHGKI